MRLIDAETLERQIMLLPDEDLCEDCCFTFVNAINDAPTVELTDEATIEHLQALGWMRRHDREMTRAPWVSVKERLPEEDFAHCVGVDGIQRFYFGDKMEPDVEVQTK